MKNLTNAQNLWAYYKYDVMAHSQKHYQQIRQLFKYNQWSEEKNSTFHYLIEDALNTPATIGSLKNAYQHIWGYFKKVATKEEKETFLILLNTLSLTNDEVKPFLAQLSIIYQIDYLLNSSLLFPQFI
ncbi:hypothetical protein CBF34_01605 [Vagococcus penaei]|uniref:Uncharacterized protein n=1 Tax=Vagococcus penaei TaxID=633807 RepID=A0A1Q2D838_9ENTE|nr:YbgA family protein [Vagococcus penaei]AQP54490.1 hypothetical protein BW732_09930 [Vagococcus penaei]RSU06801.1 hypothetical protein CBF34_01605 [Vagococcus penaei]